MENSNTIKDLTPDEKAMAEKRVYDAFVKEMTVGYQKPSVNFDEFVRYPEWVRWVMVNQNTVVFSLLIIIGLSLWVISSDKTYGVFHAGVVNSQIVIPKIGNVGVVWALLVGLAAVVFIEGGLFYSGFAQMRNRITAEIAGQAEKSERHAITLTGILWSVIFFSGLGLILQGLWDAFRGWRSGQLIERNESDSNLSHLSSLLMAMAILTNVYGSIIPKIEKYEGQAISASHQIEIALAGFLGVLTAVSLHIVGQQVALFVYGYYRDEKRRQKSYADAHWQRLINEQWTVEGEYRIANELDRVWRVKNKHLPDGKSPYLLTEGQAVQADPPLAENKVIESSDSFRVFLTASTNGKNGNIH